jgi:hypothetical protein
LLEAGGDIATRIPAHHLHNRTLSHFPNFTVSQKPS